VKQAGGIDFNGILQFANVIVAALIGYALVDLDANEYIDHTTLLLGLVLCLQTWFVLKLERQRRDPFVIMLAFHMIFYFALRLFTLALYPYSVVFARYDYDVGDSNYAMAFILASNVLLYAGLFAVRIRETVVSSSGWQASRPQGVVALMVVAILFGYFRGGFWTEDNIPRFMNFLVGLLTPDITILMAMTYLLLFRKSLSRGFALVVGATIALDIIVHTLWGSRSALVGFAQNCLIAVLVVNGFLRIPRKYVTLGVLAAPFMAVLLVAMFTISSYNRIARASAGGIEAKLDLGAAISGATESGGDLVSGPALDVILQPVFARAGFFDFGAEIIAHREEYRSIFNFTSYGRSLIDNILTPGFDLYDMPKLSNSLQFVYRGWGEPSKQQASGDFYQSDQVQIYGELYAVFMWGALPLMFLIAVAFKTFYVRISDPLPFMRAIKRVVLLFLFVKVINSFGLDWVLGEAIPLIAGIYITSYLFGARRVSGPTPAVAPALAAPQT
jgi:hypothetical protein